MIKELLIKHEGLKLKPYYCSEGKLSIGVGLNLEEGITPEEALMLLDSRVNSAINEITRDFLWYQKLNDVRKAVIVNMVYNMGISRFKGFKKTIQFIEDKNYKQAAKEMLDSKWANQVGDRAIELSQMMEEG